MNAVWLKALDRIVHVCAGTLHPSHDGLHLDCHSRVVAQQQSVTTQKAPGKLGACFFQNQEASSMMRFAII